MKNYATIFVLASLWIAVPTAYAQTSAYVAVSESAAAAHLADVRQHIPDFAFSQRRIDQLETVTTQTWATDWENATQTRYSYVGDQQSEVLNLNWDGEDWVNDFRTTTSFEGGLPAVQQRETWVNDGWEPDTRTVLSYDGGALVETVEQNWQNGDWINVMRTRLMSSGGVIVEWESDVWEDSDWILESRAQFEESGGDVHLIQQTRSGGEWINEDRTTYSGITREELIDFFYDLSEQIDAYVGFGFILALPDFLQEEWDGEQWVNVYRQITEEDDQGRPVFFTSEMWEEGEWVSESRLERVYGEDGSIESVEFQIFDNGEWMAFATESYTYGENGLLAEVLEQVHVGTETINVSLITLDWTSTTTASEADAVPVDFVLESVYPNPFNPVANVAYELNAPARVAVRVYDALGRQVATLAEGLHAVGRYEVSFDASNRPSGLYIVRLETPYHRQARTVSLIR